MILGLFINELQIPVVPLIFIVLSVLVLLGGIAFMIFRHVYEKGESDIDPALYVKISHIAAWVFVIYMAIELIAACACICVNDACRSGYHYEIKKSECLFCSSYGSLHPHSSASDCLLLGIYFDAFIVNALVANSIKVVKEKIDKFRKDHE